MRTQIIEKTVYSFSDLETNEELKRKVLEKNDDINVTYNWAEYSIDDFKELSKIIGIDIKDMYFSGFWSQGDGACFTGSYQYRKNALKDLIAYSPQDNDLHEAVKQLQVFQRKCFYAMTVKITQMGNYCHENTMVFDFDTQIDKMSIGSKIDSLEREFKALFKWLAKWLYRKLEKEYEYLTSETAILGTLQANEYEFYLDGSIA